MKASLTVALAIAGACLAGRAEAQTVVVGPQAGSIALLPGARVTVPIVADLSGSGGASLGSATAQLLWRPGVLAYLGVSGGALGQPVVNADSAGGSLRFAVANPAGATGQPVLINATFAVIGTAGADDTLRLQLQELTRAVTFADLLPLGVVTGSHLCVSTGDFGDLNDDQAVTSFDALLMITSAVGLPIAPYSVVNGDVDADGQVTTRDALIALSYAIALPVGGFRVGRMNPGTCSVQTPASVQIAPQGASVAVGDRFPLTATVRDSVGGLVQGVDLVWTSGDTSVVKADATGHLVGTKAGSARVYAFAAPGLSDSAAVTVDSLRRVWWVNPALAALNGGVELGSQTYPFSSIGQALARVADDDSVMVAPAVYGEAVHLTRPLTLLGDSGATGVTTIRNPTAPGIAVDPIPGGGLVRVDHLRVQDSQGGVVARGGGTEVLSLARLTVTASTSTGISARNLARLTVDETMVDGAVQRGIDVDSVPQVRLHVVGVDAVSQSGITSALPDGIRVARVDTLRLDSVQALTAGVWVDSAQVVALRHVNVVGTVGPAVAANVAVAFTMDSSEIRGSAAPQPGDSAGAVSVALGTTATARLAYTTIADHQRTGLILFNGDSALLAGVSLTRSPAAGGSTAALIFGQRRVAVQGSQFLDNGDAAVHFDNAVAGRMVVTVDTSGFRASPLRVYGAAQLAVHSVQLQNTGGSALAVTNTPQVSLVHVDQSGVQATPDFSPSVGPFAVDIGAADSVALDSLSIHDNPFGAVRCTGCRALAATRSQFLRNGTYGGPIQTGQISGLYLENPTQVSLRGVSLDGGGDAGLALQLAGNGSRIAVDSSALAGARYQIRAQQLQDLGAGDTLLVTRSTFSGHGANPSTGVSVSSALTGLTITGSTFDSLFTGVDVEYSTGPATVYGNTFTALAQGALHAYYTAPVLFDSNAVGTVPVCTNGGAAVDLYATTATVSRNTIAGCVMGVQAGSYTSTRNLAIRGNTIARDAATLGAGVSITDSYDSVAVVGNTITGGQGYGLELNGNYNGIGAARVDSNTVQGVHGSGVIIGGSITQPLPMTYNVVADNDSDGITTTVPLAASLNTVARNHRYGIRANTIGSTYFRSANFSGNGQYAVWNDYGEYYVFADTSYWGDAKGPRCGFGCDSTSTGDSVTTYAVYQPYVGAPVAGAPPIPAPIPAPRFRVASRPAAALPARSPAPRVARPTAPVAVRPRRVQP